MKGATLKSRAVTFALCAGGVVFFLSLLVTANENFVAGQYARALIPAIVCAVMCWASTQRTVATTAEAIDLAVERMAAAAAGDLASPIPPQIGESVPALGEAMTSLLGQFGVTLDRIERLAMFDPVTGLSNRAHFRSVCDSMLTMMAGDARCALLFIDLDRFKAVNDTKGHAVGDMLLAGVADRLREIADVAVRDRGLIAPVLGRLAGDEFTIFLPAIRNGADATWIGNEVVRALSEPFEINDNAIEIGASVGVALRADHGRTLHELMRSADVAMYHAKENGRGRVEHFGSALAAGLAQRVVLEGELRHAIDEEQFSLVFQPQLRFDGENYVAAEALLRWQHPTDGLRLPGSFLDRAEESGLIVEIGDWVVTRVAQTISHWASLGLESRLAINVSPRQLTHATFFRRLRDELRIVGAPARLLELELGETTAMQCPDDLIQAIEALRSDGAKVAIGGFGTGYTNIARLRSLPIDRIKLDRTLIAPIVDNAGARSIVQALIGLIHGIGLEAVGEGIETSAQSEVLRILGCDVIQGFGVAEPMTERDFLDWIADRSQAVA